MTKQNYKQAAETALKLLRRDRDRQILARRFGFGLEKKQTLEHIGKNFGITRERVRQIEKAAITKLKSATSGQISEIEAAITNVIQTHGGIASLTTVAKAFGADGAGETAYLVFLAELADKIAVIDENDHLCAGFGLLPDYSQKQIQALSAQLVKAITTHGKPTTLAKVASGLDANLPSEALGQLGALTKALAHLDGKWGLLSWPEVNPKSIRDKTYLVLGKHGQPLHFAEIATAIHKTGLGKRQVTVQAVHNELIKDARFVLIGRGIYALADWGYTPGTVADIIVDVLRDEAPLHKDEIVRRVLTKRQVKTTTIILNLQEKPQFIRVAKATYRLAD